MITKEAIEAGVAAFESAFNGSPNSTEMVTTILTAAFAAMPGPAVKVGQRGGGGGYTMIPLPETYLARSCIRCGGVEEMPEDGITCAICIEAIRTGSEPNGANRSPKPALGPEVKVRELVWDRESPTQWQLETWKAQSLVDEYDIQREKDGTFSGFAPNAGTNIFSSLEAAKAAAQADYEARILSALTPAPDLAPENERLRAALEFVQLWAWREDPPNANRKLTDEERLSAIKYHPSIRPSREVLDHT